MTDYLVDERKICARCKEAKPLDDFHKSKSRRMGVRPYCKRCETLDARRRYQALEGEGKEKFLTYHQQFYKKYGAKSRGRNPRAFLRDLVGAARQRKWPFEITLDYLVELFVEQEGRCAYTGERMTWKRGVGKVDTNISMDRVDSSVGYLPGNVVLCCARVNIMKGTLTPDELKMWCRRILEGGQ